MSVALQPLVERLKAALVNPGSTSGLFDFTDPREDDWVIALGNAFWQARMWRFFADWRLNSTWDAIIPVVEDGEEFPEDLQHLVVLIAALTALENKLPEMNSKFSSKSGEEEFSVENSATLLSNLFKARRQDLEDLKADLVQSPLTVARNVGVIDMVVERADTWYETWIAA